MSDSLKLPTSNYDSSLKRSLEIAKAQDLTIGETVAKARIEAIKRAHDERYAQGISQILGQCDPTAEQGLGRALAEAVLKERRKTQQRLLLKFAGFTPVLTATGCALGMAFIPAACAGLGLGVLVAIATIDD